MIHQAVAEIFDQGLAVLEGLSDSHYTVKHPEVYGGSIGGHYRHVLEHFTTLYEGYQEGFVNYDLRKRDTTIENSRMAAMESTQRLRAKWLQLDPAIYDNPIELQGKLSHGSDECMHCASSVARETAYSIAHAQHHYAIIHTMCSLLKLTATEGFGIAASTVAHQKGQDKVVAVAQ
ncbi:hypothetical protein [Rubritalea marina]|uniref:hypothetical protein n=1 Tax=Rubritalea marina TaxID=361055 RepID=UPI00037E782F|nr:hypothetical protein [Rubritalea marina]